MKKDKHQEGGEVGGGGGGSGWPSTALSTKSGWWHSLKEVLPTDNFGWMSTGLRLSFSRGVLESRSFTWGEQGEKVFPPTAVRLGGNWAVLLLTL